MLIQMPTVSPMYAAYEAQKQQFDAAIDLAVIEAAKKVGSQTVAKMFQLVSAKQERKAA